MIRYKCAQCGADLEAPQSLVGEKEICPVCNAANWVPQILVAPQVAVVDQARPAVQPMNCPKCGKRASEYQPNKWECLYCGRRFIYEPPRHPDSYVRIEQVTSFDDSSFYVCADCGGKFPKHSYAEFTCKKCKKAFCPEHVDKQMKGYCKQCALALTMAYGCGCLIVIIIICVIAGLAKGC